MDTDIKTDQYSKQIKYSKDMAKLASGDDYEEGILNNVSVGKQINLQKTTFMTTKPLTLIVDSRERKASPINILDTKLKYLPNNALTTINGQSYIDVTLEKHGFLKGDLIILQNAKSSVYQYKGGIELTNNSYYVKVTHLNHGLGSLISTDYDFEIELSGVQGNNNKYKIGNIPISIINGIHKIYLTSDIINVASDDYYFIKLDTLTSLSTTTVTDTTSNIVIKFRNLNGLPLNVINANYPLTKDQLYGHHIVEKILNTNSFRISVKDYTAKKTGSGGGSNMYVSLITSIVEGFPNPNYYKIHLKSQILNVSRVRILNTNFPNNPKLIEKGINSKLYWEVLDNSGIIYNISIETGNYTALTLKSAIETKINETEFIPLQDAIQTSGKATINNSNKFVSSVTINQSTSIFNVIIYKTVSLQNGIYKLNIADIIDTNKRIEVTHPNHGLVAGQEVIISGAIATESIPASVLNQSFTIEKVIDANTYQIKLPIYNEDTSVTAANGGGLEVVLKIPIKIRMFFDKSDTLGNVLGFTRVGDPVAVTPFGFYVANNKPYANDNFIDSIGNTIKYDSVEDTIQNNDIVLDCPNYFIMTCDILNNRYKNVTTDINNAFAKITVTGDHTEVICDQFTQLVEYFDKPIDVITDVLFTFKKYDGSDWNFYGKEHSFVLEFTETISTLSQGSYDTKRGIINVTDESNDFQPFNTGENSKYSIYDSKNLKE